MIRERIEEKLRAAFQPVFLEVVDESYRHNVPAEELSTTVHALALHTYTIKEWEGLQDTVFASPPCRGAGSIA